MVDPAKYRPIGPYVILPSGLTLPFFDTHGNVQIAIQDQHSKAFSFRLAQNPGESTVATQTAIESHTLVVASATGATIGDYVAIFRGTMGETTDVYVGKILNIATNTFTLDTPISHVFEVGDTVLFRDVDIQAANGSVTPVIFDLPLAPGSVSVDITRVIFTIVCSTEPDDSLFGNIAALTNGLVLRVNSATEGITNICNIKTNGDFAATAYDVTYTDKAGGGAFGVRCLLTFNSQSHFGITLRLNGGDKLELIVQDDLTTLNKFRAIAQGHVVE